MASLEGNPRVMTLDETWVKTFSHVDLDNVYSPFYLPPFDDNSGEAANFLNSLDVIWVSNEWIIKAPSQSTQSYLRYELHVEPFLEKAIMNGWDVEDVPGYGKIYRKTQRT